jgi:formylglycine-generating enzyme required for sulfatase activity
METFKEKELGMDFLQIPGGLFMMGDTFGDGMEDETPVHEVRIDGFWMGMYQVTQAQWRRLMPENPSKFKGETHPVEQVSWHSVQTFIEKMMEANEGKFRFDLPTEAQWEYAARSGGKAELYAGGDDVDHLAWYEANSGAMTHPVGLKLANGLGLHDMSGNVWEWCKDIFHSDAYNRHARKDPVFLEHGQGRVIRGGSWNLDAWSVRCARRSSLGADLFASGLGFRLIMRS